MPYKDRATRNEKGREYTRLWRERQANYKELRKTYPSYGVLYAKPSRQARIAHQRVHRAIKAGKIERPTICPRCQRTVFVEAAHLDYTGWMNIIWLCRRCHRKEDAGTPKGATTKLLYAEGTDGRTLGAAPAQRTDGERGRVQQ